MSRDESFLSPVSVTIFQKRKHSQQFIFARLIRFFFFPDADGNQIQSYKRSVTLNLASQPNISLHSVDNDSPLDSKGGGGGAMMTVVPPDVLNRLMDICAADISASDQKMQMQLIAR